MPEPHNPLDGVDAPRPMPAELRARLEQALLAGASMPEDARRRISQTLSDPAAAVLAGIDGPRPLPARTRQRVERALVKPRGKPVAARTSRTWMAAAAVVTLFLASVTVLRSVPEDRDTATQGASGDASLDAGDFEGAIGGAAGVGDPGFSPPAPIPDSVPLLEPLSGGTDNGPAATGGRAGSGTTLSDPPPFALDDSETSTVDSKGLKGGQPPPPFRIALVGGDANAVAGFNAYVDILNRSGGAGRRPFVVVQPHQAADVRVNLSGAAAPSAGGVTVDNLFAPDRVLRGSTFAFAGPIDRQGHLIADALYPTNASATAVVFHEPDGVLGNEVPAAIEGALRAKGLTVVRAAVRPGERVVPVPADAAFLSLTPESAKRVVAAYPAGARPPRGFNGVASLAEQPAVTGLPPGSRFISPYAFPASREARRMAELTRLPAGARVLNGWVTAKTLAVAVWRYDPRSSDALRGALYGMNGYANGFAPAYTYRPDTTAVRPEGVLFTVTDNGLSQVGEFLTDPRS